MLVDADRFGMRGARESGAEAAIILYRNGWEMFGLFSFLASSS
jgi:hypothetical protein